MSQQFRYLGHKWDARAAPLQWQQSYFGLVCPLRDNNPLGKRVWYDHDHPQDFVIVGVVRDAKHNSLREPASPQFYLFFFNPKGDEPSFSPSRLHQSRRGHGARTGGDRSAVDKRRGWPLIRRANSGHNTLPIGRNRRSSDMYNASRNAVNK